LELMAALAMLAGGDIVQREAVTLCHVHTARVRWAGLFVAAYAGICLCWRLFSSAVASGSPGDAERDHATLAMVVLILLAMLERLLGTIGELVALRRARDVQTRTDLQLVELRRERDGLRREAEVWREKAERSERSVSSIRKQAENQADEYMRLMCENKGLRNQLADFDIVMGGARKKAS